MKYELTINNNSKLPKILEIGDEVYTREMYVPTYVIQYYRSNGSELHYIQGTDRSISLPYIIGPSAKSDWLPRESYNELLKYNKYILTNKSLNLNKIIELNNRSIVYIPSNISQDIKDKIHQLNKLNILECKLIESDEVPPDSIPFNSISPNFNNIGTKVDKNTKHYKIIQYLGNCEFDYYRRVKLSNYIVNNLTKDYLAITKDDIYKYLCNTADIYIISDPRNSKFMLENYNNSTNSILVYDRTDNWSALNDSTKLIESEVIAKSDIIFTSSKYLYEDIPSEYRSKAKYIPNGTYVEPYIKVPKYDRKSAIYAGVRSNKVDLNTLIKLAKLNPDWDIIVHLEINEFNSSDIPNNLIFRDIIPESRLVHELSKCHIGLIPFIKSDWTDGMLPLKLFNYINAHIPTLYSNCDECREYSKVTTELIDNYNLDTLYESMNKSDEDYESILSECDWKSKFKLMTEIMIEKQLNKD